MPEFAGTIAFLPQEIYSYDWDVNAGLLLEGDPGMVHSIPYV